MPAGVIKGGQEPGRDLIICRANYAGGKHPGKVVDCACNFGYGGSEVRATNYEVLAGNADIRWVDVVGPDGPKFNLGIGGTYNDNGLGFTVITDKSTLPSSGQVYYAFQGGWEADGRPLVICNGKYYPGSNWLSRNTSSSRGRHPGKVVNNCCNFGYGGGEIQWCHEFRIMVVKGQVR